MAKVSPVSIKYLMHANFMAEGALEKPDVIGALFGQTEGLLGEDLEMRDLQKEGKIGRIEVNLRRENKRTIGEIKIPTALNKSETTLMGAAIETIERIGPSDAQIEVERIEDVRSSKRDYIIERAKKLMKSIEGTTDSREISREIKTSSKIAELREYGKEKLPYGTLDEDKIIVVEGRADVLNLLRAGINNVIAMNGTKLPDEIKELSEEKDIILFLDGDRGGKLIARNAVDNANIKEITQAPDGKEVEELTSKEILMSLRKKQTPEEFFKSDTYKKTEKTNLEEDETQKNKNHQEQEKTTITENEREKLEEISRKNKDSGKAILLNQDLKPVKEISVKSLISSLKRMDKKPFALVIDGTVTKSLINILEKSNTKAITAKNFAATSDEIEMLSP